jgi:hypothetical protein
MKITKIYKEAFKGKVYNFHCMPSENYFSCNMLVHNCYKCNGGNQLTHNMTLNEFKTIFDKMPKLLTQIAFGIMNCHTNPDMFAMFEYARKNGVIPNYTTHGLDVTDDVVKETARLCGAVAVSVVQKEKTYESIQKFIAAGMKQCNIHFMICDETYDKAFEIIDDISTDKRLTGFNAIVFLQYKAKGRNPDAFHSMKEFEKYSKLIDYCEQRKVNYGFDSCGAGRFMHVRPQMAIYAEPCESGLFSSYINCHGVFFPCSFSEDVEKGIDVLNCSDFLKDVWHSDTLNKWREKLLSSTNNCKCEFKTNCRQCPVFDLPCHPTKRNALISVF